MTEDLMQIQGQLAQQNLNTENSVFSLIPKPEQNKRTKLEREESSIWLPACLLLETVLSYSLAWTGICYEP